MPAVQRTLHLMARLLCRIDRLFRDSCRQHVNTQPAAVRLFCRGSRCSCSWARCRHLASPLPSCVLGVFLRACDACCCSNWRWSWVGERQVPSVTTTHGDPVDRIAPHVSAMQPLHTFLPTQVAPTYPTRHLSSPFISSLGVVAYAERSTLISRVGAMPEAQDLDSTTDRNSRYDCLNSPFVELATPFTLWCAQTPAW